MTTLGAIAEIRIGPFGTMLHREDYIEGGHALVNPSHILDGKIVVDPKLTISDEKYNELASYRMIPGDIVLGRRGEMGRCAVVTENDLLCGTGSMVIRPGKLIKPYFLQNIISSPSYCAIMESKAVGVTMMNLNVPIVSNLAFPLLPLDMQERFISFIEQSDKSKLVLSRVANAMNILSAKGLEQKLLQKNRHLINMRCKYMSTAYESGFYPTLAEFDPGVSADVYAKYFKEAAERSPEQLDVLYFLYQMGGEGTCKQIASVFGNKYQHYIAHANLLSARINDGENVRKWVRRNGSKAGTEAGWTVLFFGKDTNEGGVFIWKLREPVVEAIEKLLQEGLLAALPVYYFDSDYLPSYLSGNKVDQLISRFSAFVKSKDNGAKPDFYNGYMQCAEGYKRDIFSSARSCLHIESWHEEQIGSCIILEQVYQALDAKDNNKENNLLDYRALAHIKSVCEAAPVKAEDILYRLFTASVPQAAFWDACEFFGNRFPEITYLLFIRDCEKYVPLRTDNHKERFRILGLNTDILNRCSWENYQIFLNIHRYIQLRIQSLLDIKANLLDAHSFVWTLSDVVKASQLDDPAVSEACDYLREARKSAQGIEQEIDNLSLEGKERESVVRVRVNQGIFKERLMRRYSRCCLCGVTLPEALIGSHIKPWAACDPAERLDPDNGLLLCPNHDKLFDRGYISFTDDGKILISPDLSANERMYMNIHSDMAIRVFSASPKYLMYHRDRIFKG